MRTSGWSGGPGIILTSRDELQIPNEPSGGLSHGKQFPRAREAPHLNEGLSWGHGQRGLGRCGGPQEHPAPGASPMPFTVGGFLGYARALGDLREVGKHCEAVA